jgi:Putative viral replication protein/RNA helicase
MYITHAMQARNHCFTLNNPGEGDEATVLAFSAKYIVFGREKGEDKKTPHLQGYIEWGSAKRIEALKKLHPKIHWEARIGTAKQASDYCKKGEQSHEEWKANGVAGSTFGKNASVVELGTISNPGKRSDLHGSKEGALDVIAEAIHAGATLEDINRDYTATFIRFHKGIEKSINLMQEHRIERPIVRWRYGKTGVGKSFAVRKEFPEHYVKDGTQWWDGYVQQECILIDDFDGHWPFRDFLRLTDEGRYQGQYKGGYVKINSPYIFITCSYPPWEVFRSPDDLEQVMRRLESVTHVKAIGEEEKVSAPK